MRFHTDFNPVFKAFKRVPYASNVYVYNTSPKMGIAIGEKYFLRADNALLSTAVILESNEGVVLRIITEGGKKRLLNFFDLGSSKDYAYNIINALEKELEIKLKN